MSNNGFYPSQIGYIPTGINATRYNSTVVIGRNNGTLWEAGGFGAGGRPDNLEYLNIYLTNVSGSSPAAYGAVSLNVGDIKSIIDANNAATALRASVAALTFKFREVYVCDGGVTKKMMIMASQPYATGA